MTLNDLRDHLQMLAEAGLGDHAVTVAGHGRLACVTRSATSTRERVVVLYVEDDVDSGTTRSAAGGPAGVAPPARGARAVPSVRPSGAEGTRGPLAVQAELPGCAS